MRVGILGGGGQLGSELVKLLRKNQCDVVAPGSAQIDIRERTAVAEWVDTSDCDVYVNCAAYTAVDAAETDADNARAINSHGAGYLADAVGSTGRRLVQISTDYVFDGQTNRPYVEDDRVGPEGVYGATKLEGEQRVLASGACAVVLRISWVYGRSGNNFVKAILRRAREQSELTVVDDQRGSPCAAGSIAGAVEAMLQTPTWPATMYHFGARPITTWFEFAREIVRQAHARGLLTRSVPVRPIKTATLNLAAARPAYSALDTSRFEQTFGHHVGDWREDLAGVLAQIAQDHSLGRPG